MSNSIETVQVPFEGTPTQRLFIKQGDTIPKVTITLSENAPISFIGATIKMQLYRLYDNSLVFDVGTDVGGITIISALVAEIDAIPKEENNFPEGSSIGDLEITTADGVRKTYFNVEYCTLKQYTK